MAVKNSDITVKDWRARYWGHAQVAIFLLLWLTPVTITALLHRPLSFVGNPLNHWWRVTDLFLKRTPSWPCWVMQGRYAGGKGAWVTLKTSDYGPMQNYGYGGRLDRILDTAGSHSRGPKVRSRLAQFVSTRHAALYPASPPMVEVRFIRISIPTGYPGIAVPQGRWLTPALEITPPAWCRIVSTHVLPKAPIQGGPRP
jgi:hypothetical protein